MVRKTADVTASAIQGWLNTLGTSPGGKKRFLLTDSGGEFVNNKVKRLMRENNFKFEQAQNINKVAIVERVNKSIQVLIYKYLTDRGEVRYLDKLGALVQGYNNRKHRTLEYLTPNEADDPKNEIRVRSIHMARYAKINEKRTKRSKFKIGDKVRVKTYALAPSSARRAYLQQFHGEYYLIRNINRRMPITMYELQSMDSGLDFEGGFYANELQLIRGDTFKIEKILRSRGQGDRKEVRVKWQFFGPQHNSWVKASDILEV